MSPAISESVQQTYGETLVQIGKSNPDVVVVEADLMKASGSKPFLSAFPERHFQVGIAEQNLVSVAGGLAAMGKIPFASSFANFISQRSCDQAFMTAYNNFNVKLVGTYAGLSSAINGGTHMSVEDIAVYRSMPNTTVIAPGDCIEFSKALEKAASIYGPVYISIARGPMPTIFPADYDFKIGKSVVMQDGSDITLITTGIATLEGIRASEALKMKGIVVRHIHMPTIKPLDKEAIVKAASETGIIVTAENHSRLGGLGSAVAETVCREQPARVETLGLNDMFGETGKLEWLMDRFEISASHIAAAIDRLLKIK